MSQDTSHHQDQQGGDQVPIAALHVRGQRTSEFLSIAGHELRNGLAHLRCSTSVVDLFPPLKEENVSAGASTELGDERGTMQQEQKKQDGQEIQQMNGEPGYESSERSLRGFEVHQKNAYLCCGVVEYRG